jgi:hypothetical protein
MLINDREYRSGSTNRQSIETGNAGHTRQRIKTKQTQITLIRHDPSYKQLEVKTNQPSFACGNHNTEPKT